MPVLDNRDLADFDKVSFTLLDQQGGRWQGNWPPFELPFADGAVRQVTGISGGSYLTQDLLLPLPHGAVWLRGYLVLDTMLFLEQATVYRLALRLPLLAVVAALGGYLLTRRAFRPIARMTRQAERILDGRDLTQRFPEGRDEGAGAWAAALTPCWSGCLPPLNGNAASPTMPPTSCARLWR